MKQLFQKSIIILVAATISLVGISGTVNAQANTQSGNQASTQTNQSGNTTTATTQTEPRITQDITDTYETIIKNVSSVLSLIIKTLNYMVWPVLVMIGGLMDTSLIYGPGIEDRLLLIWSQVRNLINLLFAIFLIGVAIYNVFGLSKDGNYAIKKVLPSLIITLVLVNFSFFGVKFLIDMSNVATTAMFALPNSVEQGFSEDRIQTLESALCNNKSLEELIKSLDPSTQALVNNSTPQTSNQFQMCTADDKFTETAKAQFRSLDKNNAALVLAISFGRIHEILDPSPLTVQNPSAINLGVNLLIVLLMELVYLSAFFTLFAVLVARIIAMWLILIASPLLVMKYTMSGVNIPGLSMIDSFKLDERFITHATAPIKIGFGMSVGYIMLDAFQSVGTPTLWYPIGDNFANAFSGVNSMQELFMGIAAIGIVWKVSIDAANGTFAQGIVEKWGGFVTGIGQKLRDLAINKIPVIPGPAGAKLSFGDMASNSRNIIDASGKKLDEVRGKKPESDKPIVNITRKESIQDIFARPDKETQINKLSTKEMELLLKGIASNDRILKGLKPNDFKLLVDKMKDRNIHKFEDSTQKLVDNIKAEQDGTYKFDNVRNVLIQDQKFRNIDSYAKYEEAIKEHNKKKSE